MKKVAITQDLCRMVELMLKGGAQQKEVGERLGISKATVSRIKTAGYDAEQYRKNTTERVEKENHAEEEEKIRFPLTVEKVEATEDGISVVARQAEEQAPGQICMDLQPAEEQKPEPLPVPTAEDLQTKMMRFLGGKFNVVDTTVQVTQAEILLHIGKIEDYLAQILRKMDG